VPDLLPAEQRARGDLLQKGEGDDLSNSASTQRFLDDVRSWLRGRYAIDADTAGIAIAAAEETAKDTTALEEFAMAWHMHLEPWKQMLQQRCRVLSPQP